MTVSQRMGFDARRALAWGTTWAVTVSIVEALAISPVDAWGSAQQMVWWLVDWAVPYWCILGALLVALSERSERIASRWRLIAGFALLSVVGAAVQPLVGSGLVNLTKDMMPAMHRYYREAGVIAPIRENWTTLAVYLLWVDFFYGALLVAICVLTARGERNRRLLHTSAMARSRTQEMLDSERLKALQEQIDPSLLLDSMQELKQRYRDNPESAERLLEALVEFMRCAMHGLRTAVSTVGAEVQLARAFAQLQQQRGVEGSWRVVEESSAQPAASHQFPSLLMLPLLALGGRGGRPLLKVRTDSGGTTLSMNGLSASVSPELCRQMRSRLKALYGDRFAIQSDSSMQSQLTITLQRNPSLQGESHERSFA